MTGAHEESLLVREREGEQKKISCSTKLLALFSRRPEFPGSGSMVGLMEGNMSIYKAGVLQK